MDSREAARDSRAVRFSRVSSTGGIWDQARDWVRHEEYEGNAGVIRKRVRVRWMNVMLYVLSVGVAHVLARIIGLTSASYFVFVGMSLVAIASIVVAKRIYMGHRFLVGCR